MASRSSIVFNRGTLVPLIITALHAQSAGAQEQKPEGQLEEVTVTAQMVSENLQDANAASAR